MDDKRWIELAKRKKQDNPFNYKNFNLKLRKNKKTKNKEKSKKRELRFFKKTY